MPDEKFFGFDNDDEVPVLGVALSCDGWEPMGVRVRDEGIQLCRAQKPVGKIRRCDW